MLKEQRIEIIMSRLSETGIVSIDELAEIMDTSRSTIRRDIEELEEQRALRKIRGGAVASKIATSYEPPFRVRQDMFYDEKQRIAAAARQLVNANETLLLGGGTSVHEFAKTLSDITPLYIATNDLMSAMELSAFSNVDLMVLGGSLRHNHFSLNGYFTEMMVGQIHADKAFIGVDAVDFNIGFMNFSADEIQTNRMLLKAANETIVLCDHSKFNKIAFVNTCSFDDVDIVITGKEVSPDNVRILEEQGVKVITV